MWFFDWFATYFSNTATWFETTANNIATVPYVGQSLSSPFRTAANYFHNVSTASGYASSWVDQTEADLSSMFSDLSTVWNYAYGSLTSGLNSVISTANAAYNYAYGSLTSGLNSVIITANAAYNYAYGTLTSGLNSVIITANAAYNYAYGTLTTTLNSVSGTATAAYNRVMNVGSGLASDVWTWISSNRIAAYLNTWKASLQSSVIAWVEGSLAYLITKGFGVLEASWSSFTTSFHWLTMKIIDLMIERASSFAAPLWSLLNAVADELWDDRS